MKKNLQVKFFQKPVLAQKLLVFWASLITMSLPAAFLSCDSVTAPGPRTTRDYQWTMYTIETPAQNQLLFTTIWGSDPSNVFVSGAFSLRSSPGKIFRFDGQAWSPIDSVSPPFSICQVILGTASNDVWFAGSGDFYDNAPLLLHYDGSMWTDRSPSIPGLRGFVSMALENSGILTLGTRNGILARYDRSVWTAETLGTGNFYLYALGVQTSTEWVAGFQDLEPPQPDSVFLFESNPASLEITREQSLDEFENGAQFGWTMPYSPQPGVYYSGALGGVLRRSQGAWTPILYMSGSINSVHGSSTDNIMAVGSEASQPYIAHWNGQDWRTIGLTSTYPDNLRLYSVYVFSQTAFVLGSDGIKSYVFVGK